MSARFIMLGGYEDNLVPEGEQVSLDPLAPRLGGSSGLFTSELGYRRTKGDSSFDAEGRGTLSAYSHLGIGPLVGGGGSASASTRVFRRTTLNGQAMSLYSPTFRLGVADAGQLTVSPLPDSPVGVSEVSSLVSGGLGSVAQEWGPRHESTLRGSYTRASGGIGFDVRSRSVGFGQSWNFTRVTRLQLMLDRSHEQAGQIDGSQLDLSSSNVMVGLEYRRRLSATRSLILSGGGGAMRIDEEMGDGTSRRYTTPSGLGTVRFDFGRTWALASTWRRDVGALVGLTPQAFRTDSATLSLGGSLGRWTTAASGGWSRGSTASGGPGDFSTTLSSVQLGYRVSNGWTLIGNYTYYRHDLQNVSLVPQAFPARFDRNAFRIGATIWLPIAGNFPPGREERR